MYVENIKYVNSVLGIYLNNNRARKSAKIVVYDNCKLCMNNDIVNF